MVGTNKMILTRENYTTQILKYATYETTNNDVEWLALRSRGIGGSDCSIIMLDNPYKKIGELWQEKKGLKEPKDISDNPAVKKGKLMEAHLRELFQLEHPEYIVINDTNTYFNKKYAFMLANLDGVIITQDNEIIGLEIKTANVRSIKEWDEIPLHYYEQIQHYMIVTGLKKFILYAYIRTPFQVYLKEYVIEAHEEDQETIIEEEKQFWESLQRDKKPKNQLKLSISI